MAGCPLCRYYGRIGLWTHVCLHPDRKTPQIIKNPMAGGEGRCKGFIDDLHKPLPGHEPPQAPLGERYQRGTKDGITSSKAL